MQYNSTSEGEWKDNTLSLRVAAGEGLEPCVLYTVTITLPNPYPKQKQMAAPGEEPKIRAFADAPGFPVLIDPMPMKLDMGAMVGLPGTSAGDEAPFLVHPLNPQP